MNCSLKKRFTQIRNNFHTIPTLRELLKERRKTDLIGEVCEFVQMYVFYNPSV